jgi:hypothetical protein
MRLGPKVIHVKKEATFVESIIPGLPCHGRVQSMKNKENSWMQTMVQYVLNRQAHYLDHYCDFFSNKCKV